MFHDQAIRAVAGDLAGRLQVTCQTEKVSKDRASGRTARGTFEPGQSGNPDGRRKRADAAPRQSAPADARPAVTDPRFDVADLMGTPDMLKQRAQMMSSSPRRGVARKDDWYNALTGQGVHGRDKRMGGFFAPMALSFDQLRDLWLGDDLAKNAVEMLAKEARRPGYDITIAEEGESEGDGDDVSQTVKDKLKDLGADAHLQTIGNYSRAYGGGAILIGANDKQTDLTQPLDLDKVVSLDHLTPYEARECIPLYAYGDPTKPRYGDPEIYQLTSRSVLPSRNGGAYAGTMRIHESRLIVFDGIRVSRYQATAARMGWGEAVLSRVWRVLRDFNTAYSAAGVLVSEFGQMVMKMQGLWSALALDDGKAYEDRMTAMAAGTSFVNALVVDAADSVERLQTPVNGLSDLMGKFDVRLAAACEMPLTLLFGTSPGGMNATGESDIRFFYDRVDEYRTSRLEPALRRLIQILFRTIGNKREPAKWSLKFKPLWQESAKDMASAMLTQAQADNTWIQAQVISPEEVADAHWGQGEYNPHLSLDHESRDAQAEANDTEATPEDLAAIGRAPAGDPAAVPQGPPIAPLMDVVKAVAGGQLPRASAAVILKTSFPTMTPEAIEAMLPPEGEPPPQPPSGPPRGPRPPAPEAEGRADASDRSKGALVAVLSPNGRCAQCFRPGAMEVDHIDGRDWSPRAASKAQRVARYWDEHDSGVKLRALCRSCNARDGAKNKQKRGDYNPDQPRAADGKFGEGSGERAAASLKDRAFMASHRDRLIAAADRYRKGIPQEQHGTDAVHAAAQAVIHEEAQKINRELDEVRGPHAEDLSRLHAEMSADNFSHENIVRNLRDTREEQGAISSARAAGHINEVPTEKLNEHLQAKAAFEQEGAQTKAALDDAQQKAIAAVADLDDAHRSLNEDAEPIIGEELVDEYSALSQTLAESLPGDHDGHDFDGDAPNPVESLSEPEPPNDVDTPPPDHNDDPGKYKPDPDLEPAEEVEERAAHAEAAAAYKETVDNWTRAHAEYQADLKTHNDEKARREVEIKTRAVAAQTALEELHAKQVAATARAAEISKVADKSHAAAVAEVSDAAGEDDHGLIKQEAFAHHETDEDTGEHVDEKVAEQYSAAARASEALLAKASSEREEIHFGFSDDARQNLKSSVRTTAAAIKTLAKITGRAPKLAKAPARKAKAAAAEDDDEPEGRLDDWEEELHPRGADGKFSSGTLSDRVNASLSDREFVEKHRERLTAAGDRVRANHPQHEHGTEIVHARAQEAIQREAAAIHLEQAAKAKLPSPESVSARTLGDPRRAEIASGMQPVERSDPKLDAIQWTPKAQADIRSHYNDLLGKYGMHSRGLAQAHEIEIRTSEGMGGAAGLHWNDTGKISLDAGQSALLYDYGKLSAQEAAALGKKAVAGDREAYKMMDSYSTMVHEVTHSHGPRMRYEQPPYTMVEELLTETAARKVVADVHGIHVSQVHDPATKAAAYDAYIAPVIEHLGKLSGKSREDAFDALAHAAVSIKGRSGTDVSPSAIAHEIGAIALTRLGVTDPDQHDALFDHMTEVAGRDP